MTKHGAWWLILLLGILHPASAGAREREGLVPPAITTENVPPVPQSLRERLRQYQHVRSAGFRGWAPDGKGILVATRFGNTRQLHRVYEPGGRREQVTFFGEPVNGTFVPRSEDAAIVFEAGQGGNENDQLYYVDPESGRPVLLTDGTSKNDLGPFTKDGRFAVVRSNRRNRKDTDLFVIDPRRPGSMRPLLETDGEYWYATDWSRDNAMLLVNHYVSINETYPALLTLTVRRSEGEGDQPRSRVEINKREIPIPGGQASFGTLKFSNDGRYAYTATDAGSEFRRLVRIDLVSFQYTTLTPDIPWNVESIEVAPPEGVRGDGNLVVFSVNEDGTSTVYALADDPTGKRERDVPFADRFLGNEPVRLDLPAGIVSSLEFSPDGRQLGFTLSPPNGPSDAYSLHTRNGKLSRWTYSEVGGLDTSNFVLPQRISYETFDGRTIPAWYFAPPGASEDEPVPVVVNVHGGPESQYRPYFSATDQFYLHELGFAVVRPNVRGSAGYGKSYLLLDNGKRREDSVKDVGALLDWIAEQPELDASRVAVMGGSYGGYMVLGSLTNFPDRFACGVDVVGIASFRTFLQNTKAYRRDLRRAEYGDERDPEMQKFFAQIDPLENAERIRVPLLVAHGKNDPRVPFSEAQQIAAAVRENGLEPWTVYAADEGHGFRKKANRDYLNEVIALFLQRHLQAPSAESDQP